MYQKDDCIFCQIARGDAPCFKVHEDDLTLTFMDVFPVVAGHTLVITREHFPNVFEATAEALSTLAMNAQRVAKAIREALRPDGLGVFQLNGAAAGQTVPHYHLHLIPRNSGDEFALHSRVRGDDQVLLATSKALAGALDRV